MNTSFSNKVTSCSFFSSAPTSGGAPGDAAAAPLTAYSGVDATGRAQRFEVGAYEAARGNLGLVGADAAQSVEIASGYRATLCRDSGLRRCTTLGSGRRSPLPSGLERDVSSLLVARAP